MANTDFRFGLRPIIAGGTTGVIRVNRYFVPASYGTALYVGDPVIITGTSNTSAAGEGNQYIAGSLPEINKATAGATNQWTGAVVGFEYDPDNLDKIYNPASTARVVLVADHPDQLFEIQADSGAAVAATDIGVNANFIFTHGGDTASGLSGVELDTSSMTGNATYQLAIVSLANRKDNELGTHAKLIVRSSLSTFDQRVAGI